MKRTVLCGVATIALIAGTAAFGQTSQPNAQNQDQRQQGAQQAPKKDQQGSQAQQNPAQQGQTGGQAQQGNQQQGNQPKAGQAQQGQNPQGGQAQQGNQQGGQAAKQGDQQGGQAAKQGNQSGQTQQGQAQQPTSPQGGQAQQGSQPAQQNAQQPQNQQNAQQPAQTQQNRQAASVQLDQQQQTRISAAIKSQHVRPLKNVNFSLSVGTRVPSSVTFATLPADVVAIVPQYRGYSYFVASNEIVIVDPGTREIVTVLPYSSGRVSAGVSERSGASNRLQFSSEQRASIRKHVSEGRAPVHRQTRSKVRYEVGRALPAEVEISEFPEVVYTEVPTLRSYRYAPIDSGGLAVIEPRGRRVIEIIE